MALFKEIIIDADFCIKVGASVKYRYLEKLLPLLASKVYLHKIVFDEILTPSSAVEQVNTLINQGLVKIIDVDDLNSLDRNIYQSTYASLATVMINPNNPGKNQGEVRSLAMAKTKSIPYFVTDERNLQPIIDKILNTGINDITCIRINDIIMQIKLGEITGFSRKEAKVLWVIAGKKKAIFDEVIWPISDL